MILQKAIKVRNKYEYFVVHFSFLNILMKEKERLSAREVEILAVVFSQDKSLIKDHLFSTPVRKVITDKLEIKPGGIVNHINRLISKGYILRDEVTRNTTLAPKYVQAFSIEENNQGYRFKIVIDEVK